MGAEGEAVNQLGNPDCILITNAKHPRAAISSNGKNQRVPGVQREVNTLQVQIWGRKKKITCECPGNAGKCLCLRARKEEQLGLPRAELGEVEVKAKATGSLPVCRRNLWWDCCQCIGSPSAERLGSATRPNAI